MNENIFRLYDVRGLISKDLDAAIYEKMGRSFGTLVKRKTGLPQPKVAVGRDNRQTGAMYQAAFSNGLLATGCDAVDIGELTTPAVYFANFFLNVEAVASITASHNPPEYNGLKMRIGEMPVSGLDIKPIFLANEFSQGKGKVSKENVEDAYVKAVSEENELAKKLKVVVDCGNGAAGKLAVAALKEIGCEVIPLYCESDPTYPHHHPDPVKPENYPDLIAAVKREKADLGVMLDGDGDRVCAVEENGNILWADSFLILFSREILSQQRGANIVVEIKCSLSVMDDVAAHGGNAVLCATGYPNVEKKMVEENAPLGGEMSGHFYFFGKKKWFSDAIYASCRLCKMISYSDKTLSEMVADAPKYFSSQEYRLHVSGEENNKVKIVEELVKEFSKEYEVITLDGARVVFPHGWGLVRYSQNEPVLSMRFESKTEQGLQEIKRVFREKLSKHPVAASF